MKARKRWIQPTRIASAGAVALAASGAAAENAKLVQVSDPYFSSRPGGVAAHPRPRRNTNRPRTPFWWWATDGLRRSPPPASSRGQQRGVDGGPTCWRGRRFPYLAAAKPVLRGRADHRFGAERRRDDRRGETRNDIMGLDHTAEVDSCEDQKTKQVTTLGSCRDHRHVDRRDHYRRSPTRRRAPPMPTSPVGSGSPMQPCRPRRSQPAARHRPPAGRDALRRRARGRDGRRPRQLPPTATADPENQDNTGSARTART